MQNKNTQTDINPDSRSNSQPTAREATTDTRDYKVPIIITSAIICLSLIGCIAALFIPNGPLSIVRNQSNNPQSNNQTQNNTSSKTKFEDLTKDEALAFLQSSTSVKGILPDGYVGNEILDAEITNGNTIISELNLVYSYDNLDELRQIVREKYRGLNYLYNENDEATTNTEDDFEITEYDYYAIITPNRIKGATTCDQGSYNDCDSLLSFKKDYLDYHQEKTVSDTGSTSVSKAFSINTTLDHEIINQLLRIYTVLGMYSYTGHGNIYSYDFEEQDDKYILTVDIIGAGINAEMLNQAQSGSSYNLVSNNPSDYLALNLYRRRFTVDKTDGKISLVKNDNSTMEDVKSIPITQEEFNSLPGYGE